jgi:radical SAM superfamily enzyme YgiQ (UPF0313 family)
MSVLVINPANKPLTNRSIIAEPIDVLQIATVIQQKYSNVKVIDMDINDLNNNINSYLEEENILVFVYDYQLPLHTTDAMNNIFETVNNCDKKIKSIVIGKTSSYYYQKFIDKNIDVVINGNCENIINDVIEDINDINKLKVIPNLYINNKSEVIKTKREKNIVNYALLPIPDRSLVDISKYMQTRTMVTSRGCNGICSYCTTPFYFGSWQGKDYKVVVNEIDMLVKDYNAKQIMFLDDNACVDKTRMINICNEIKKRNINVLLGTLCSIKCYDKEMFKLMYEVGFRWVHFGIETGSQRLLKLMHKEMNYNYIKTVIGEVKNTGYRVRNSFILDYPSSTEEDIKATKDLILELQPDELRLHYLAYRVGTPIFNSNKEISSNSQYIHSNKPNIENKNLENAINNLLNALKEDGYEIVTDNIDWNVFNNSNSKIASFIPIKYGINWHE